MEKDGMEKKEYYTNGKLEFKGEYLNGEWWNGKGKEYHPDVESEFEVEYLKGERKKEWKRKRIIINIDKY